mgnify:CR=1 FL=1
MRDDVRERSSKTLSIVAYAVGLTSGPERASCRNVQIVRARILRGLTGDWDEACATAIRRLGMERLIRAKIFLCLNAEL